MPAKKITRTITHKNIRRRSKKAKTAAKKVRVTVPAKTFAGLVDLMRILRSPNGCPWDREQTHESILSHLIEETYEVVEAVHANDMPELRDELGDLLLHVIFHAQLAGERGDFRIDDVIKAIHSKLIRRHPHVFGDLAGKIKNAGDVKKKWAETKRQEENKSLLGGIPKAMPAMQRAWRLNDKASSIGFDWQKTSEVLDKLTEERAELEEAIASGDQQHIMEEFGDLMFCMINLSRFLKIDPERALNYTSDKFIRRFEYMEKAATQSGRPLESMNLVELEALYQESRKYHT